MENHSRQQLVLLWQELAVTHTPQLLPPPHMQVLQVQAQAPYRDGVWGGVLSHGIGA